MDYIQTLIGEWPLYLRTLVLAGLVLAVHSLVVVLRRASRAILMREKNRRC